MLVEIADFVGKYELSSSMFTDTTIQSYIDKYEKYYLTLLLGVTEYNAFIDDLDVNNEPQTAKYTYIYDAFSYDNDGSIIMSNGIKEMLLGLIYYHYINDSIEYNTPIGNVNHTLDNSTLQGITSNTLSRFNDSVVTFQNIQKYICDNLDTYLNFNGQWLPINYIL
jgi:hypothetical protein